MSFTVSAASVFSRLRRLRLFLLDSPSLLVLSLFFSLLLFFCVVVSACVAALTYDSLTACCRLLR